MQMSRPANAAPCTVKSQGNIFRLECMYTSQLNKKRKTWSDGILKLMIDGGIYHCTLLDAADVREIGLESRPLEPSEIVRFQKRVDHHLQMDQYIIDVTFPSTTPSIGDGPSTEINKVAPKPILPKKFVPPSKYIPPPKPTQNIPNFMPPNNVPTSTTMGHNMMNPVPNRATNNNYSKYKKYDIAPDEIDEIWGDNSTRNDDYHSTNNTTNPPPQTRQQLTHTSSIPRQNIFQNQPRTAITSRFLSNDYDDAPDNGNTNTAWDETAADNTHRHSIHSHTATSTAKRAKRDNYEEADEYIQVNAPNRHVATLSRTSALPSSTSSGNTADTRTNARYPTQEGAVGGHRNVTMTTHKASHLSQSIPSKPFIPPQSSIRGGIQAADDYILDEYNITDDIWN